MEEGILQKGKFRRKIENFTCEYCGTFVEGNGYTDHCTKCLRSKHVDKYPGDRSSGCGGMMEPISAEYRHGEYKILYKCKKCGEEKNVVAAENDNKDLLMELATKVRRLSKH
ncbi:MAG: RNHCP domain-containing protein [Candidatus Micrarchaeia archaeon]